MFLSVYGTAQSYGVIPEPWCSADRGFSYHSAGKETTPWNRVWT
jgi:hypothetical protein